MDEKYKFILDKRDQTMASWWLGAETLIKDIYISDFDEVTLKRANRRSKEPNMSQDAEEEIEPLIDLYFSHSNHFLLFGGQTHEDTPSWDCLWDILPHFEGPEFEFEPLNLRVAKCYHPLAAEPGCCEHNHGWRTIPSSHDGEMPPMIAAGNTRWECCTWSHRYQGVSISDYHDLSPGLGHNCRHDCPPAMDSTTRRMD